ncbi:hypothetical protein ACOBR2_20000 [Telmatobacter bradus]|uniref:hypothetical protein n=1 Tax=Telmatobacter bradus TaxID=474953 RepID=UPI003B4382D7
MANKWAADRVLHLYGLPDVKAKAKGRMSINADGIRFSVNGLATSLPIANILAVHTGNERVELWGVKGRILRMMLPDGGGTLLATFLHHRIDMLTVEYRDDKGGYHAAVFELPAKEAVRAMQMAAQYASSSRPQPQCGHCEGQQVQAHTVQLELPDWQDQHVPFAYRALVYEHLISDLNHSKQDLTVYRDGELGAKQQCAQYTVVLREDRFQAGSQVARAIIGPLAYFVGYTQISFYMSVSDATGHELYSKQIKAAVHDEAENNKVAEKSAKKLSKKFAKWKKQCEKLAQSAQMAS